MLADKSQYLVYFPLFAIAGFALGTVYFRVLGRQLDHFLGGGSPWRGAAYALGRIVVAALALAAAGRFGPVALLGASVGFLAARTAAVFKARRTHD